ncbi:MAG: hypothetical protein WBN81_14885 [Gammaproteobacteria bacterium]
MSAINPVTAMLAAVVTFGLYTRSYTTGEITFLFFRTGVRTAMILIEACTVSI